MVDNDDRSVRELIESATVAFARGRPQDAELFLRQAQAVAPCHPLVLNETARQMLLVGNPASACALIGHATEDDPSYVQLWLNLAAVPRALKRPDGEMAVIDKALAIEPQNLRGMLQKASLQECQGNTSAAAITYRMALQRIPSGAELQASMREVLQHANELISANHRALESFLEERLKYFRTHHASGRVGRFDRCLTTLRHKHPIYRPRPSFAYFPYLPALEFHERGDVPWLDSIGSATDDIRAELFTVLDVGPLTLDPDVDLPAGVPLNQWQERNRSRRWSVYAFLREGVAFPEHIGRCPRAVAALEPWPRSESGLWGRDPSLTIYSSMRCGMAATSHAPC
jgi:aspartate beta-hydroxylase